MVLKNSEIKETTFSSDIIRPLIVVVRQKKARDNAHLNRFTGAYLGGMIVPRPLFLTLPFSKKTKLMGTSD